MTATKRENKQQTNFTLSPTAKRLIHKLADAEGLSHSSWIERTIRELARQRGLAETHNKSTSN